MRQIFITRKGKIVLERVPDPRVRRGFVLVKNLYSLISTGTEKRSVQRSENIITRAVKNPRTLFAKGITYGYGKIREKLLERSTLGYATVGTIIEKGDDVHNLRVGDLVMCAGFDYASHAELALVPKHLTTRVPNGVAPEEAVFATVGSIALHGIRNAHARLGETVMVVGLGLIGQLTLQLLKATGCTVIGIDLDKNKCALAQTLGANHVLTKVTQPIHDVDALIICAEIHDTHQLKTLISTLRDRGTIVAVGNITIPSELLYRKEIRLIVSRSMGPGRYDPHYEEDGVDYPIGYVRWTEQRNITAFLELVRKKTVNVKPLISASFPFDDAPRAYASLRRGTILGILLHYSTDAQRKEHIIPVTQHKPFKGAITVSFIGTGGYAKNVLLPTLTKNPHYHLRSIVSADGTRAKTIAQLFGAPYASTDFDAATRDPETDVLFIATRNALHASMALRAAQQRKAVFLEKPMALNADECAKIANVVTKHNIAFTVGLNRRFSPVARKLKTLLKPGTPVMINYQWNIERGTTWIEDEGGRVMHLLCHAVDLCAWVLDAEPHTVYAQAMGASKHAVSDDNVTIVLTFSDGSVLNLFLSTQDNTSFTREHATFHQGSRVIEINEFQELIVHDTIPETYSFPHHDKGQKAQLAAFARYLQGDTNAEIVTLADGMRATITCLKILESLQKDKPLTVNWEQFMPSRASSRTASSKPHAANHSS